MILTARSLVYLVIFVFASVVTLSLYQSQYLHQFFYIIKPVWLLPAFISGMLYTTFFTSPVAVLFIVLLSNENDPLVIAIIGGLGTMFFDLIFLRLIRHLYNKIFRRVFGFIHDTKFKKNIQKTFKFKVSKVLNPLSILIGSIIIASPLPDEIGIAILGLSTLSTFRIAVISFIFNALGIYTISLIARSLM